MTTLTLDRPNVSISCEDPGVPTKRTLGGIHTIAEYIAFSMQTFEDPDTDTSYVAPICGDDEWHDYGPIEVSALLGIGGGFLGLSDREITCEGDDEEAYRGSGRVRLHLTRCLEIAPACNSELLQASPFLPCPQINQSFPGSPGLFYAHFCCQNFRDRIGNVFPDVSFDRGRV
jgi:hypothetical protein